MPKKSDRFPDLISQDELDRMEHGPTGRDPRFGPGSGFVIVSAGWLAVLAGIALFVAVAG